MTPEVEARRAWAYALLSRCQTPPPRYGSPEWLALPDGPHKVGAVVVAAECWAIDGDHLLERLATELAAERAAFKATEDADFLARRAAHKEAWDGPRGRFRPDPQIVAEVEREWRDWAGGEAG